MFTHGQMRKKMYARKFSKLECPCLPASKGFPFINPKSILKCVHMGLEVEVWRNDINSQLTYFWQVLWVLQVCFAVKRLDLSSMIGCSRFSGRLIMRPYWHPVEQIVASMSGTSGKKNLTLSLLECCWNTFYIVLHSLFYTEQKMDAACLISTE